MPRSICSARAGSWIGVPDYALLEETLARGLGLWPLPKLALILLLLVLMRVARGCVGCRGRLGICSIEAFDARLC